MIVRKLALGGLILATTVLLVLAAMVGSDWRHERFDTYAELTRSELLEKGWVPDFVPASSRDISVNWNNDFDVAIASFTLDRPALEALIGQLNREGWGRLAAKSSGALGFENRAYTAELDPASGIVTIRSKYGT